MKILSLNAGSNSLKFEIVDVQPDSPDQSKSDFGQTLTKGSYDNIGKPNGIFTLFEGKRAIHEAEVDARSYQHAAALLLEWLASDDARRRGVAEYENLDRVGHRVVHGADLFFAPALIDEEVVRKIEQLEDLAPLHNASALSVIREIQQNKADGLPMVAVFDTLFHQTMPDHAALYPLPKSLAAEHKIRRYGFHGISHQYMLRRYAQIQERPEESVNVITLHLEGGSSAAAIRHGLSVDTSMGFTPLEGLMMGTRSGDIDPAIVPYLMRKASLDAKGIEDLLNKESGLLGVSGITADTREMRKHLANADVRLALEMFSYRVRKYVGAYLAVLGGAEAIIFGGGIGENTPFVREDICRGLQFAGIEIDRYVNEKAIDREAKISTAESRVQLWVIPTEEALLVAYETAKLAI